MAEPTAAAIWWRRPWTLVFILAGLAVAARNLADLAGSPSGFYIDEASIGYNAWTISRHGVDEHGAGWPLFFSAFGEYKNPLYIYVLVPLVRLFGPTPTVVRLPAALFGLVTVVAMAGFARQVTGSRWIALATLLIAAATPWLVLESRVGFEVISMVACIAVMLWCLSHVRGEPGDRRWFLLAGIAAGLAVYAYSVGRLEVGLLTVASLLCFGRTRRELGAWLWLGAPVAVAYLGLGVWALQHPGALTARLGLISIGVDHPSVPVLVGRFIVNMLTYWSPGFLFVFGDANPRHNTGFLGMLLVTTLPLMAIGLVTCARRIRQGLPGFVIAGFLLGPVSAALTAEGTPHALRDASSLPFLLATITYGCVGLRILLGRRRLVLAVPLGVAILIEAVAFNVDLVAGYPARAAFAFDGPEVAAINRAHDQAGGHTVWLSGRLEQPYIEAAFFTLPPPPDHDVGEASIGIELAERGFKEISTPYLPGLPLQSGDLLVLASDQNPPPGALLQFDESALFPGQSGGRPGRFTAAAVRVWLVP